MWIDIYHISLEDYQNIKYVINWQFVSSYIAYTSRFSDLFSHLALFICNFRVLFFCKSVLKGLVWIPYFNPCCCVPIQASMWNLRYFENGTVSIPSLLHRTLNPHFAFNKPNIYKVHSFFGILLTGMLTFKGNNNRHTFANTAQLW